MGCSKNRFAEPLGFLPCFRTVASGKQDQELLSAIAAHGVVGPDVRLHSSRDFAKHGVAGQMSVGVIDGLEVIQVGDQNAEGKRLRAGSARFPAPGFPESRRGSTLRSEYRAWP